MVFSTESDSTLKVSMSIWDLERAIKVLPRYRLLRKWKLQDELAEMRVVAAQVGFKIAIKDLKNMGILD